jgi:hypothetical protein
MNAGLYQTKVGRSILSLLLAVIVAMSALSIPVLVDLAGIPVVTTANACQSQGSGCG